MNDKKWSNYQLDIFKAIKDSDKNIIVNAVAVETGYIQP